METEYVERDLMSDEELTCYQLPRNDTNENVSTPGSPVFTYLPSSLCRTQHSHSEDGKCMEVDVNTSPTMPTTMIRKSNEPTEVFKSLGMTDKDISWVSSMESLVDQKDIRVDYNTIEKATFFPDPNIVHGSQIQPRALFPMSSTESLGFKPLNSSFLKDDDSLEPYTKEMRLSDVCAVLKTLNVINNSNNFAKTPDKCYDFQVGNDKTDNSPLFEPSVPKKCNQLLEEENKSSQLQWNTGLMSPIFNKCFTDGKEKISPHRSSTPSRENQCSSPSLFSPIINQNKVAVLSPIPEAESHQDSELEIFLDGSIPQMFSESVKKRSPLKEESSLCVKRINGQNKKTAAKCLVYNDEVPNIFTDTNMQPADFVKQIVSTETQPVKKIPKKLYGYAKNITILERDEDEIFKDLMMNENLSAQFLNTRKRNKDLPVEKEFTAFKQLNLNENGDSRKRICKLNISRQQPHMVDANLDPKHTVQCETFAVPETLTKNVHVKATGWTSKVQYLVDSQADVTDTQIFEAVEAAETSFITCTKNKNPERRIGKKVNATSTLKQLKRQYNSFDVKSLFSNFKEEDSHKSRTDAVLLSENHSSLEDFVGNKKLECKNGQSLLNLDSTVNVETEPEKIQSNLLNLDPTERNGEEVYGFDAGGSTLVEFRTGNNSIIKPSNESHKKMRKMLSDCEEKDGKSGDCESTFAGFRTGNNSIIKPSDESLKKVRKMLPDCEEKEVKSGDCESFAGFRTGNNSIIKPSDESLKKVRRMLSDCEEKEVKSNDCESTFAGFRTGNNSIIKPSDESLKKVRKMLSDCEEKEVKSGDCESTFAGFRTGNNSIIKPSDESLKKVRNMLSDCEEKEGKSGDCESTFAGFRTGNNSIIKPSDESLKKVRKMLSDCEGKEVKSSDCESFAGFRTGNNSIIKPSDESLKKVRKMLSDCEEKEVKSGDCESTFAGFRTGNNSIIKPSDESLKKVRKMLSDCEEKEVKSGDCESFAGFRTGNNSIIKPSDESLKKVRKMLSDCEEKEVKSGDCESTFAGFRTGNNSIIKPSDESLKKVRKMLSDCEEKEVKSGDCESFAGFRTGNNSIIKPSDESLKKVRKMLSDCEEKEVKSGDCESFAGFRTGNNSIIKPSDESLKKVRKMLSDCEEIEVKSGDRESTFTGLRTGNNSIIKPSDESIIKVRKLLANGDGTSCQDLRCEEKSGTESKVIGFATENNIIMNAVPQSLCLNRSANEASSNLDNENYIVNNINSKKFESESYSALLDNTDWDESILPSWFHSSQISKEEDGSIESCIIGSKRPSSSIEETANKRFKLEEEDRSLFVIEQRKRARELQSLMGGAQKRKVKPDAGFLLKREKTFSWLQVLPDGPKNLSYGQLSELGIKDFILDITFDNARYFRFKAAHFYSSEVYKENIGGIPVGDGFLVILDDDNSFGAAEVERAFLSGPGVAPDLIPAGWVAHHYGLIVWKLACYERSCPTLLGGKSLTPDTLLLYLKYRYDREIDQSKSSAIKRILERDDPAGKPLVLTVAKVNKLVDGYELLLTDGWYTCPARPDIALECALKSGKLAIGTKVLTQGAELVGCEQGSHPLQMVPGSFLKIASNSTRRVRWYQKMGFQKLSHPLPIPLNSILSGGGNVSCLRAAIVRVYPLVYVEKTEDGRNVSRNIRAERKAAMNFQSQQEAQMEKMYAQIENESNSRPKRRATRGSLSVKDVSKIQNPEELCFVLENAPDPSSIEALLSEQQRQLVWKYQDDRRSSAGRLLEEKLKAAKVKQRSVRSVLRVRLIDISATSCKNSALLSWWQPPEELMSLVSEGKTIRLYNVTPGNSRSHQQIYLNSTRQTRIDILSTTGNFYPSRTIFRISDISPNTEPPFGELDFAGLVVFVHSSGCGSSSLQTVYFTDNGDNFFGLVFWRGLREFCCEDTLAEGLVVGVSNVQWRKSSGTGAIPLGHVTETTVFAQHSKSSLVQEAINDLKEDLEGEDIASLIERSQDTITRILDSYSVKNSSSVNTSNLSSNSPSFLDKSSPKVRPTRGDCSLQSKPAILSDTSIVNEESPQSRPRYLNGFAQKPRASSTPVRTPRTPLQRRLEQLQQIGEPPPLSPISASVSRRVTRSFKLPLDAAESPPMDL